MIQPFQLALGQDLDFAAQPLRAYLRQPPGLRRYKGVMHRVWRRPGLRGLLSGALLRLGTRANLLFPETGANIPFEYIMDVRRGPDGALQYHWSRVFHFCGVTRRFDGVASYASSRRRVVDRAGPRRLL